jgi:hypothetical protein
MYLTFTGIEISFGNCGSRFPSKKEKVKQIF